MAEIILPVVTMLIGTLTGGSLMLLNSQMNIRAARQDRLRDFRQKCYTEIIANLKKASAAAAVVDDGYNSGEGGYTPEEYFRSPDRPEQEAAAYLAWAECRSVFCANSLILSERFRDRFQELRDCLPTEHEQHLPPSDAARKARCLRKAQNDLFRIAQRDLDLRSD